MFITLFTNKECKKQKALGIFFALFFITPVICLAYSTTTIKNVGSAKHDFIVGPGKVEVTVNPGGQQTVNLMVTNRTGADQFFELGTEDFMGSTTTKQTVVLLGNDKGPYSLKNYLSFDESRFKLKNGERATVPVTITIPLDAEPGGLYASVLVGVTSGSAAGVTADGASGGSVLVSRLGVLFFVRVPGDVHTEGVLQDFKITQNRSIFLNKPILFQLFYENTGNVSVNPYGEITIQNIFGEEIGFQEISPWFAMPQSLRLRELSWNKDFLFGRYTATAKINRGYDDIIDTKNLIFYVLPWKVIIGGFAIIIIALLSMRWFVLRLVRGVTKNY